MGITINDIKKAFLDGGDISAFIPTLRQVLADPPVTTVSSLEQLIVLPQATALLRRADYGLSSLLNAWLVGKGYDGSLSQEIDLTIIGLAPYGRNINRYLEHIISEIEPDIVAIDISPVGLSANMLYAFGMPCAVGIPIYYEVLFKEDGQLYTEGKFYPGNMIQSAIVKCWLSRVPLIPVGMPSVPRHFPRAMVDRTYLDKEIAKSKLLAAYHAFDESLGKIHLLHEGIKITPHVCKTCSSLSSIARAEISEKIIEEASYIASRITEVSSFVRRPSKHAKLLAIVDLKHYQDTQCFIEFLKKGIMEEVYLSPHHDVPAAILTMASKHSATLNEYVQQHTPETTPIQELFGKELRKLSTVKGNEQLPESDIDNLIAAVVSRTREHPDVARSASVRGAIAFKEVLRGFGEIQSGLTRNNIEKSALVTLPPRISTKQGDIESASDIVSNIAKEVLYGIRFSKGKSETVLPDKVGWLSPEDIMTALQNLTPAQLSQEQKQQLARKDRVVIVQEDNRQKLSEYLTSKDFPQDGMGKRYSFSKEAIQQSIEELERRLGRGEITKDQYQREKSKLEEMLSAASQLQAQMSSKELAETVMEFMDAKDKHWQKELDFQDMYIYYHIKGTCEGKQLSPPKRGWYGLRVVIDHLEKRGILRTPAVGKSFTLTGEALHSLLEHLVARARRGGELKSLIGYGKAQFSELDNDIRRYTIGDVFRDISVRHTLREIAKDKKELADISRRDFKVFMRRQRKLQSDIVLCLDDSGSMGFRQRLIYARLAAAGLARAALENGDRVGLVTFDDVGKTILPLTSKREEIFDHIVTIHAGGNTNIGDGIECATELLLHESSRNQKHIILVTDGEPTAMSQKAFDQFKPTKEKDLSEECAIIESRKASSSGVVVSVIHVTDYKEVGREFVRNIAKAGKGQVRTISTVEDIRLMVQ